ncbi:hypothetical protein [Amycolatopsis aidingensis]|uniref:hypothetical protein n=1 Tax=Amycolatopsis aidingensis TaxID=2842453 RepID=UPI001C0D5AC9|nr:hypothetical protein [Amycolatopsis aidingensis]
MPPWTPVPTRPISPIGCRQARPGLLRYAANQFAEHAPNTWACLDGGNASWIPAWTMAPRLDQAGVRGAMRLIDGR